MRREVRDVLLELTAGLGTECVRARGDRGPVHGREAQGERGGEGEPRGGARPEREAGPRPAAQRRIGTGMPFASAHATASG